MFIDAGYIGTYTGELLTFYVLYCYGENDMFSVSIIVQ